MTEAMDTKPQRSRRSCYEKSARGAFVVEKQVDDRFQFCAKKGDRLHDHCTAGVRLEVSKLSLA